jgi:hypothetical protein
LFNEVHGINQYLGDDEASYTLFQSIEPRDPQLASQCYFVVEHQLVDKGEYEICRKYMGDAQSRFQLDCSQYQMSLDQEARMTGLRHRQEEQEEQMRQQHGWTNLPAFHPPDTSAFLKKSTEDRFVSNIRDLIEVLVATGDKSEAKDLQKKALAVLDDPRLKSAVSDAEARAKKAQ